METYFSKFPIIVYNNITTRNITERVTINKSNIQAFYPHELKEYQRSDVVAHAYYGDSYLNWLIYLANGITDPYYDWYLSDNDLNSYLEKKYGSIEESQKRISHYSTNWADDPVNISVAAFNAQPEITSKYYQPVFGYRGKILSYSRREEDWTANTNKMIKLDLTYSSDDDTLQADEIIDVWYNGEIVGGAEIITINRDLVGTNNYLIMQHVSGYYEPTYTVVGETSGVTATITAQTILQTVIDDSEFVYWQAVYFYDVEVLKNEENRFIYLLDSRFALETSSNITDQLNRV